MTKPLISQLSQRESPQPRGARRPRTWLVALLGFGAADLLVLNLWAVPSLITNTTTTDMRAAQSGEPQGAAEPEAQPQAAAQPADLHAEPDSPSQPAQAALQDDSPSQYGARVAQPVDPEAQAAVAARREDPAAQPGESPAEQGQYAPQPAAAAREEGASSSRGARSAHQADATSARGTRPGQQVDTASQRAVRSAHQGAGNVQPATPQANGTAQDGTAAYPGIQAAQDRTPTAQQREVATQGDLAHGAAEGPGDSAAQPRQQREAAAQAELQRGAAARPYDSAGPTAQQREAAARSGDSAALTAQQREAAARSGDSVAQAELQRGAAVRPGDFAAQAPLQPGAAARPEDLAAQAAQQRGAAMRPSDSAQAAQQRAAAASPGNAEPQPGAADPTAQAELQRGAATAPEGEQAAAAYAAQQAQEAAVGDPAAARDDWAGRAPRAEAPPGGAPPSREVADVPSDPAVARAFAVRAAQRAVRVALTDRNAFHDDGPFDALTVADQPLTQIFFSLGNYSLGPNGKQMLERKLPQLTKDQRPILIVGAADPSGPEQVNEKLSDARAQSVAEWLLAHGVDAQRIQTHAIGHEGAVGSTLDRRVDIWLGGSR